MAPVCENCHDEGYREHGDVMQGCSECTIGARGDYYAFRDNGPLPFRLGTLDEYLDAEVKRGRVDNRHVEVR